MITVEIFKPGLGLIYNNRQYRTPVTFMIPDKTTDRIKNTLTSVYHLTENIHFKLTNSLPEEKVVEKKTRSEAGSKKEVQYTQVAPKVNETIVSETPETEPEPEEEIDEIDALTFGDRNSSEGKRKRK